MQDEQFEKPVEFAAVPDGQGVQYQVLSFANRLVPRGQGAQPDALALTAKNPLGQLEQLTDPGGEY